MNAIDTSVVAYRCRDARNVFIIECSFSARRDGSEKRNNSIREASYTLCSVRIRLGYSHYARAECLHIKNVYTQQHDAALQRVLNLINMLLLIISLEVSTCVRAE